MEERRSKQILIMLGPGINMGTREMDMEKEERQGKRDTVFLIKMKQKQ